MGGVNTPSQPDSVRSSPPSGSVDSVLSGQTSKLQSLNIHDDQPVIIPNHLQVPESERTHLSFGSFGAGFGTSFSSSYGNEEKASTAIAETIPVNEPPVEQQNTTRYFGCYVDFRSAYVMRLHFRLRAVPTFYSLLKKFP